VASHPMRQWQAYTFDVGIGVTFKMSLNCG